MEETTEEFFKALLLSQQDETAEDLGFNVGDKFVVSELLESPNCEFEVGDIVTLYSDDRSSCPYFKSQGGTVAYEEFACLIPLSIYNEKMGIAVDKEVVAGTPDSSPSEDVGEEVVPLTPFQAAGYTKDTKFRVTAYSEYFTEGDIVWLARDDGTLFPKFTNGEEELYMALPEHVEHGNWLEVVTEDSPVASCASPETTIGESEYVGSQIEQNGSTELTEGLKGIKVSSNIVFTLELDGVKYSFDQEAFNELYNKVYTEWHKHWEIFGE